MKIIQSVSHMQRLTRSLPRPIVLVPTMGALHKGHLSLVKRARQKAGKEGTVVTSIFVNPTQFGPKEDFKKYPRPFKTDCALLRNAECNIVFAPDSEEMYFEDRSISVLESNLSIVMCGASRPGHFNGVCMVVSKLFNIVQPDVALFGEKDFQQLAIIRRMVRDLNFPIQILSCPTVRESDGLALSSRNRFLTPEERTQAPIIFQTLLEAEEKVRAGMTSARLLETSMERQIGRASLARIDYVVAVHPETLQKNAKTSLPLLVAAAVFFGNTRLIDNRLIK
jgi:pantoate--beta-alanine ligase